MWIADLGRLFERIKRSRLVSSAIIGSGLVLAAGTAGVADSAVVYNGCENLATGVVRLLTNTNLPPPWNGCLTAAVIQANHLPQALTEVPVSWNQQGQSGIQGPKGVKGDQGTQGDQGPIGPKGDTGATGATGPAGAAGAAGPPGPKGDTGAQGAQGLKGDPGPAGAPGPAGPKGDPGPAGAPGPAGGSLSSLDALAGLACNLGTSAAGTIAIAYEPTTHAVSLTCTPVNKTLSVAISAEEVGGAAATLPAGAVVTTQPSGISCPSTCSATFPFASSVTLAESAPAGWGFVGWGGPCSGRAVTCTVAMSSNQSVTATFVHGYTLTLNVTGPYSSDSCSVWLDGTTHCASGYSYGTVTGSAGGISCANAIDSGSQVCTYQFAAGTPVTLTATNDNGAFTTFLWWYGDCSGTTTTCTITMSQDRSVTAVY